MLKISLILDEQQRSALTKLLERLDYEIVRDCVDRVEEAKALLSVLQELRKAVEQKVPVTPTLRWEPR